jgi:hypothetical protein
MLSTFQEENLTRRLKYLMKDQTKEDKSIDPNALPNVNRVVLERSAQMRWT